MTEHPIPLNFEISETFFEQGFMTRREFVMRIKEFLPNQLLKRKASDANRLLRGAGRRTLRDVENDVKKWITETGDSIAQIFGLSHGTAFKAAVALPSGVKAVSINGLKFIVESKLDYLKGL